MQMNLEF